MGWNNPFDDKDYKILLNAWKPLKKLKVSDWTANYRVLDSSASAEPGAWRNERTPYLVEIMDMFNNRKVEQITLLFATQLGKTEAIINMLLYSIDQDPSPSILVMPRNDDCDYMIVNRLRPAFLRSPKLEEHKITLGLKGFKLDTMPIYFATSSSPADLASRPCGRIFFDEIDKAPPFVGKESDPLSLVMHRFRTFKYGRKLVISSTPTTRHGPIYKRHQLSDQRLYYVPCPYCKTYQPLEFKNLKWDKRVKKKEKIETNSLAWYECCECKKSIKDKDKPMMLIRGVWKPKEVKLKATGELVKYKISKHIGYHLSCLYSPWLSFGEIVVEFLTKKNTLEGLMDFRNGWLAEPWEDRNFHIIPEILLQKKKDYPRYQVPEGVKFLVAGVDTQEKDFYYVIRGFGLFERSWLIDEGRVDSFAELTQRLLKNEYTGKDFSKHQVQMICIDSGGHHSQDVYNYVFECIKTYGMRIRAIRGETKIKTLFKATSEAVDPRTGTRILKAPKVWNVNVNILKDKFVLHLQASPGQPGEFSLHKDVYDEYFDHLCGEQKILNRKTGLYGWEPVSSHAQIHLRDCEIYALAAAEMVPMYSRIKAEGNISIQDPKSVFKKKESDGEVIHMKPSIKSPYNFDNVDMALQRHRDKQVFGGKGWSDL